MIEFDGDTPVLTYRVPPEPAAAASWDPKDPTVPPPSGAFLDWSRAPPPLYPPKWVPLIVSALLVGYTTTLVDLASVWMNDLKKGFCFSRLDRWSLVAPYSTCPPGDWHNWSQIIFGHSGWASSVLVNFPIYVVFAAAFASAACWATWRAPAIARSGIPEIKMIVAGYNRGVDDYLGLHTLVYKCAGLVLVVSSGLWLGKEGPLVHIACCLLNLVFGQVYRRGGGNEYARRELLSAAAAMGVAVAFNAPIGGVLFMLEALHSYFIPTKIMWNSFVSATVAVVVLTSFRIFTDGANFVEGDLFSVEFGNFSWLYMELVPYVVLGVVGGVYGYAFVRANAYYDRGLRAAVQRVAARLCRAPPAFGRVCEVMAVLALTVVLNFPLEITRLPLPAYLKLLFTDCPDRSDPSASTGDTSGLNFVCTPSDRSFSLQLVFILVQGFVLSSYTYGVSLPGGVLMPSLALGATCGRFVGLASQATQNAFGWGLTESCTKRSCLVSPSSYAVVGAASFMAGITKLTMCVVVIIFELTGAVSYVLPIMIAVMVSKFVNDWLCKDNIYDQWLRREFGQSSGRGSGWCNFSNSTSSVRNRLPNVATSRVMLPIARTRCIELARTYTAAEVETLVQSELEGFPVIGSQRAAVALGYVPRAQLAEAVAAAVRGPLAFTLASGALPHSVISEQLRQPRPQLEPVSVALTVEKSLIDITDRTPVLSLLEMFEKLHLNYALVTQSGGAGDAIVCGFVDRYMLSRLIDSRFSSLNEDSLPNDLDIAPNDLDIAPTADLLV
ncbi:Chloride channel protein [[Candida] zeylanoides]